MSDSDSTLSRGPPLDSTAEFVGVEDPTHPAESATAAWPAGEGPRPGADGSRYIFGEVFAFGGLGLVRRAEDRRLGRVVAVKELLRDSPDAQRRFTREATITARLQHPGIVPIYDLGWRDTGEPFYSMKFVDGETLDAKIRAADGLNGRLRLLEHVIAVADAIAYAHDQNIIHRDLKPANVLIGRFGETVVIDWGLAKDLASTSALDISTSLRSPRDSAPPHDLTRDGAVLGTLRYMPPEQARGESVDKRSDVYALGAMLYHVLAGQPPFSDTSGSTLWHLVHAGKITPLRELDPAIPRELAAIAHRAMALRPKDRYATASEFAEDLRRFQTGRMVSAHRYTALERLRKWVRPRRARLGAGLAVALAACSAVLAYRAQLDPCTGGQATMAALWNDQRRDTIKTALAAAGPGFSAEVWPRVAADLDAYAERWAAEHHGACLTHLRGEMSDALFDRRLACLSERASALQQTTSLLMEADPAVAVRAVDLVTQLPKIAACGDVAALEAAVPLPADPYRAAAVADLRRDLARVLPLSRAGRPADALALAERAVRTAESLDYPPVLAEALLERGRAGIHNNEAWQVRGPLQRALVLAVGSRADDVAAEAAVFQLYARTVSNDIHAAAADLPLTEALVARAPSAARLRGELLHNAAVLALAQGEPERARALYHAALQAKQEAHGSDALEIAYTLANRAMVAVDPHAQEEDLRRAIAIFEHNLGAVHPEAIAARIIAGNYTDDPHEALEILQPACDALKRLAADPLEQRGICLARVSQQYAELDLPEEERAFLRQAADAIRATASADTEEKKVILGLAAATEGGDLQLEAELRRYARGLPTKTWWQRRNRGDVHYALAALLRARGDLPGAADMIARAVEDFLAGAEDVQDIAYHQRLHRARIILAELSLAAGPLSGERVVQLARHLDAALQWYADRGDTYEWRRERIRELQRELARRSGALEAPARD